MSWRAWRAAVVTAAAACQAACQAYRPIGLGAAPLAGAVRFDLTAAAAERLAPALGAGVAAVEGRVADVAGDTLRVAVTETTLANGQAVEWRGERVSFARADVAAVRQRRPSAVRSALLGLAVVGGAVLLATQVGNDSGEGTGRGGGTNPR